MARSVYGPARGRQHGVVVVILVVLLLLGGFMFALGTVKVAAIGVERERSSNDVLAQAKGALIDAAVSDNSRPGQLPCPDVNDDGEATSPADFDVATGACVSLIGRLPWKTLGLPDLRDDSGERLWYAVSNDFRANNTGMALVPLNSDTAFRAGNVSLTLNGFTPGTNLAAIVIAPGAVLKRSDGHSQVRGCGAACNAIDFLDIASGEDNANVANRMFVSAQRSDTFNDRLMPVYSDDIMRLVERRAAREFAQQLRNHYDAWDTTTVVSGVNKGFYPYAAAYGDPYTAQVGTNGTTAGLLPVATTPLTWSNPSLGCVAAGSTLNCNALVICLVICLPTLSAQIDDVGTRFVDLPTAANVQVLLGLSLGGSPTWTLNKAARRLEFSYGGFLTAGVIQIQVSAPQASSWLASSWLITNNWHQSAYYALSSGYAIDGAQVCGGAGPACMAIANTTAPTSDKHALVVLSGRQLATAGQTARPLSTPVALSELFEGLNADATLTQFETNARTLTFNDTAVAVRP